MQDNQFKYSDERFADLQMLRSRLNGFESLSLSQKLYIFCLAKATLMGRDITFDQQGKYNLRIRKTLEALYLYYKVREEAESDVEGDLDSGVWNLQNIGHFSRKEVCRDDRKSAAVGEGNSEADDEIAHDKIDDLVSDPHREAREGGLIYI